MNADRIAEAIVEHSKLVIVLLFVATLVVGSGASQVDQSASMDSFQTETEAADKLEYIEQNFRTEGQNRTTVQVVVRGDNVLSKESLLSSLRFQQALYENETVDGTLADAPAVVDVSNAVAIAAIQRERAQSGQPGGAPPSLDEQISAVESLNESEVDSLVSGILGDSSQGGDGGAAPGGDALALMPIDYDPGSTTADARVMLVFQSVPADSSGTDLPEDVAAGQLAVQDIAEADLGSDSFVFGIGIVNDETGRSIGDSFTIIGPLALLLVIVTLVIAYRDLVDIVLSTLGIGLVLVWMQGFMGWAGIDFSTTLIAVPILLIGLAIDYAIHVFMRHREAREEDPDASVDVTMKRALAGVGVALVWVTVTTSIGFLSNLSSPLPPLQNFGLASAAGIVAALFVFGALIPALKVEVDGLLERFGFDRRKKPFGGEGRGVGRLLAIGSIGAKRAPIAVLLVALVLSAGGAYGATQVDTSFDRSDFLTEEPPGWMKELPEPFAPGEYNIRQNAEYINGKFLQQDSSSKAELLIQESGGSITDPDTLERVQQVRDRVRDSETVITLADGEPRIVGPLSTIQQVAARNASFAETVADADTDGDGVPDRNLQAVYDQLYQVSPDEARRVIARDDGEYVALRMQVAIQGGSPVPQVRDEMQAAVEPAQGNGLTATATGQPVLTAIIQDGLLETVVVTLVVTVLAVLAVLVIGYRLFTGYGSLGAITLLPVVLSLAWVLGAMWLLKIPFNAQTALITSLGIGLGVDYSIHMSERFTDELDRLGSVDDAVSATVGGTGGALLGSAVTTASGFSVLALAIVPSLQRFGIVIGLAIVFAFVAAVLVFPSLLVLWGRVVPNETATTRPDATVRQES
ncbi:efflux RND transporter permease subunit [Haloarchaeobius sp. DYHT-AS-18]|uniref:efflux RND transporter permease subunit n=1 Tax=Haloarchaeobius sp. DYHT-AS-18 TaxID=3446117 RepID=UPI003EBA033A